MPFIASFVRHLSLFFGYYETSFIVIGKRLLAVADIRFYGNYYKIQLSSSKFDNFKSIKFIFRA